MNSILKDLALHISSDWMKPRGPVVKICRDVISFELKLNGIKSIQEECEDYAKVNPGVLRIENLSGVVVWKPQ